MFFTYFYGPYENYFSLITTIIYQDAQYVSLTDLLILYIMIPVSKGLIPPVLALGWKNNLGTRYLKTSEVTYSWMESFLM